MTDKEESTVAKKPVEQTSADTSATEKNTETSSCKKGSCCKPHASLYISVLALLLAGYAAFTSSAAHDNGAMQTQLNQLNGNVSNLNNQLETLSSEVQNNRDNLVQNKLKKALENIRDISDVAEEKTREAISKVENMLQALTRTEDETTASEQTSNSNTESVTEAIQPKVTQPEATQSEVSQSEEKVQPKATIEKTSTSATDKPEDTASEPAVSEATVSEPTDSEATATQATESTEGEINTDSTPSATNNEAIETDMPESILTPEADLNIPQAL